MVDIRNRKGKHEIEVELSADQTSAELLGDNHMLSMRDKHSICVLMFLYVLQGIPLGLAGSVPLMLQSKKVSYSTQATFSFAFWPFSMKILWAPLVDAVYSTRLGRRKTWLVPSQYLIGLTMLFMSNRAQSWIDSVDVAVWPLTAAFFLLNMLAATQDVAVDGWALTMLSPRAVGWASTCNTVGQTLGYFIAFIVFLGLESPQFCNSWLRSVPADTGLVTFDGFLYFWGLVFIVTTTLVLVFKAENRTVSPHKTPSLLSELVWSDSPPLPPSLSSSLSQSVAATGDMHDIDGNDADVGNDDNRHDVADSTSLSLWDTYATLWRIMRLRPVLGYLATLALLKLGFSATDSLTGLKLIEHGVSKEKMAMIGSLLVPVEIVVALLVSRCTTGTEPLRVFVIACVPRLVFGPIFAALVWATPLFREGGEGSDYPTGYYATLALLYSVHQVTVCPMFVSVMAFYARISDPAVGGTYMTLLNTVTNLASNVPGTLMLYLVDRLSSKRCHGGLHDGLACNTKLELESCTRTTNGMRGACVTVIDGYYIEVAVCTVIGFVTVLARRRQLEQLQNLPLHSWRVFSR